MLIAQRHGARMDVLTVFGALSVTAMLVCYALERQSPAFVLAFAAACLSSSLYGFLQGAWPFGVVELIWSGVAVQRWLRVRREPTGRSE
jgi:hypothetical protein